MHDAEAVALRAHQGQRTRHSGGLAVPRMEARLHGRGQRAEQAAVLGLQPRDALHQLELRLGAKQVDIPCMSCPVRSPAGQLWGVVESPGWPPGSHGTRSAPAAPLSSVLSVTSEGALHAAQEHARRGARAAPLYMLNVLRCTSSS